MTEQSSDGTERIGQCIVCTANLYETSNWAVDEQGQLGHRDCFERSQDSATDQEADR